MARPNRGCQCWSLVIGTGSARCSCVIKDVPTISTLFLLNGLAAGLVCLMLATRLRAFAALAGIGVSAGALVSLAIARFGSGGLFDYVEPTVRGPVATSVAAEVIAIASLAAYLALRTQSSAEVAAAGRPQRTRPRVSPEA